MSACQDINSSSESSTAPSSSTNYSSMDLSMNNLKICFTEFLSSEYIEISTSGSNLSSGDDYKCNVMRDDEGKDSNNKNPNISACEKGFSNCVAIPAPGGLTSSISGLLDGERGQEDSNTSGVNVVCYPQSLLLLLPIPLKIVSAMKGSREKQGVLPKKLSVIWAPDVYDPIPMTASHVPSSKKQHRRSSSKKHGKYKHKSGGKGKDKKQSSGA